jgi:hypothetical protein
MRPNVPTDVYLVQHTHEFEDGSESIKTIGIYSSRSEADAAVARASMWEGFRQYRDGFSVDRYTVDEDNWVSGFFTDA